MTVLNALFLYLNDKLSYSKCQRIKISVNYVHCDNIYFKKSLITSILSHVDNGCSCFRQANGSLRMSGLSPVSLTNVSIQKNEKHRFFVSSSWLNQASFLKEIPMTVLGNCSKFALDFNLFMMSFFLIVKKTLFEVDA